MVFPDVHLTEHGVLFTLYYPHLFDRDPAVVEAPGLPWLALGMGCGATKEGEGRPLGWIVGCTALGINPISMPLFLPTPEVLIRLIIRAIGHEVVGFGPRHLQLDHSSIPAPLPIRLRIIVHAGSQVQACAQGSNGWVTARFRPVHRVQMDG